MAKLLQAESEDAYRQVLERFAQDLPVTNRTIKGGIVHQFYFIIKYIR